MTKGTILITGGAGYVGSHSAFVLAKAGWKVVTYDDLSRGHRRFVRFGPLVQNDVLDTDALTDAMLQHKPDAVLHCAALIEVSESVKNPMAFHKTNVLGTDSVLRAMAAAGVLNLVFSSTCATYGAPKALPLTENHPQNPINPYGASKLLAELAIRHAAQSFGLRSVVLRYFNAAGAAPEVGLGELHDPETHVIPLALFTLLGKRPIFRIFGEDYDTHDGTAVRDYVHVLDLANAHLLALESLLNGGPSASYNVGAGVGVSVKTLLATIQSVTGLAVKTETAPRRQGDPAALVAASNRIADELGWRPLRDVDDIVRSAWKWHSEIEDASCTKN